MADNIIPVYEEVYNCILCSGFNPCLKRCTIPCQRCQIKNLQLHNQRLMEKLKYILNLSSELLKINLYERQAIDRTMRRSDEPMGVDMPDQELKKFDLSNDEYQQQLAHWHFVTITFDPAKFGISNDQDDEKMYILNQITKLVKEKMYIQNVYGCFEYTKNNQLHAHFICHVRDNGYKSLLKRAFTDNPKNNIVIKCLPARFPDVITYINKESTDYFKTKIWQVYGPKGMVPPAPIS